MFAEPSMPERRPSPGLQLNLSSNNPFRRAASPAFPSPASANRSSSGSRPMSRNPFISTFEAEFNKEASRDLVDMSATMKESPKKSTFGFAAEELFPPNMDRFRRFVMQFADYPALTQANLTIDDSDKKRAPPPRPAPARSGTDPRAGHRPSRSEEERRAERMREASRGGSRPRGPPSSSRPPHLSSPERRENRRPRRNSESSIIDRGSLDPREERRRRERRKEREERAKDGKDKNGKRVRRPQGLDLIDKLDVTGIYGPSMIHHDGPYDAVQPHRNRKKDQRAPMHAFPVGSANNTLGGSGPLNTKIDLDRIHGRGAEGFTDFAGAETEWKKPAPVAAEFSAKGREDIVHGEQTHGLGTSTFLEGAPASRKAIQEESDAQRQKQLAEGGLGRKKSIAQRFRGISQPRRYGDGPRITSPEARYGSATSPSGPYSAGAISQTKATEQNPFFSDDYDKAYDAKGATIKTNEGGPSPPRGAALQRSITTDSVGSPTGEGKPSGGFLNRVKSLKGGRRRPA
ncbi:Pal1-domain-containing protein [Alternaria alternata]|uniref:Pal1-domain-containing protein n=1 Tax=Alternaria alternata TaxID=5599 RepID=A0A177DU41_ALTAL|nr:Pal1-domain-containing protein [Alternaria alternata]OAG22998.1 Pal1-domain-containing protein [Alternaria alternata]